MNEEAEFDELPTNSYDLIDFLDKLIPHRCILMGETPEAAHRRAGARALVDLLVAAKEEDIYNATAAD